MDHYGDFEWLEETHDYIQWLFPLSVGSIHNRYSQPLTRAEAEAFRSDEQLRSNVCHALDMMLHFYGLKLVQNAEANGFEVIRETNWRDRFDNLQRRTHNYKRICRILKCLGDVGLSHLQGPIAKCFLDMVTDQLELVNLSESLLFYFLPTLLDGQWRAVLQHRALTFLKPDPELDPIDVPGAFGQRVKQYYAHRQPHICQEIPADRVERVRLDAQRAWFQLAFLWGLGCNSNRWSPQIVAAFSAEMLQLFRNIMDDKNIAVVCQWCTYSQERPPKRFTQGAWEDVKRLFFSPNVHNIHDWGRVLQRFASRYLH